MKTNPHIMKKASEEKRTSKQILDESRMLAIAKRVWDNKNSTHTREKLSALCRASFRSTYKEEFKGAFGEIWERAKGLNTKKPMNDGKKKS